MDALILVDLQNDFCSGGALAVPDGELVVPIANELQLKFPLVVATQDWHPRDHGSFAVNHSGKQPGDVIQLDGLQQTLWPVHCVQNTTGAELHPLLHRARIAKVIHKGTNPRVDSYSGFFDNGHRQATGLGDFLKERGVRRVFVCGVATDYCVKFTALDAIRLGFETVLVEDACRGVNLRPNDSRDAVSEMREKGVVIVTSHEIEAMLSPRTDNSPILFYGAENELWRILEFLGPSDRTRWPKRGRPRNIISRLRNSWARRTPKRFVRHLRQESQKSLAACVQFRFAKTGSKSETR